MIEVTIDATVSTQGCLDLCEWLLRNWDHAKDEAYFLDELGGRQERAFVTRDALEEVYGLVQRWDHACMHHHIVYLFHDDETGLLFRLRFA